MPDSTTGSELKTFYDRARYDADRAAQPNPSGDFNPCRGVAEAGIPSQL
jgi:hypothetical protein